MPSAFLWPMSVPFALRAPAPVNLGVRPQRTAVAAHLLLQAMKTASLLLLLVTTVAAAQNIKQTQLPKGHPLLGTWRIELQNGCFEEYTLRADGTKLSESGQERNESIFEISEQPLPGGFYKWTDKIIKGNGKQDCGGSVTELGHVAVNFMKLHPNGTRFLLCEAPDMKSCYAEFVRKSVGA